MSSTQRIPSAQRQLFQRAYDQNDNRKAHEYADALTRRYPEDAFGWHALAKLHYRRKALDEALQASQQACELGTDAAAKRQAEYWALCGRIYFDLDQLPEAEQALTQAAELDPDEAETLLLLGHTYHRQERPKQAVKTLDRALELSPNSANILATRIMVFAKARYYSTVMRDCRTLMALKPSKASYYNLVGARYNEIGDFEQAQYYFAEALKRDPNFFGAACNAITGLHYDPEASAEQIYERILTWQPAFAGKARPPVPADQHPDRQIRIGLLSPGFNMHPVGHMILAGMLNLKRANLELYYYNLERKRDPVTFQLMRTARHWKDVYTHSQDELEALLRADELDILLDLTGHNDQSKLPLISRKPAPLILKWVGGQINTVGLDAIDYFLSDHIETPSGVDDWYVEKLIRLPDDYICYTIPSYSPDPGDLPALANGYLTLGCLNNLTKINPQLLAHWARLMQALPGSHLILKGPQCEDEDYCQGLRDQLAEHGIAPERLELQGPSLHKAFMTTYQQIDIALDPWPYSGGLTTCEALAMGVPVVTLPGPTFAGRHAASHLTNAGLADLVVDSWEGYQQRVLDLARDLPALAELRASLRERLRRSPLCDGKRFAENLDGALRAIWQRYCEGKAPAALDFIDQGQCQFEDESAPVLLQHPAPYLTARRAAERRFSWQLPGKLVVIDNSAKLLRQEGIDNLLRLDAFGIVAFDPSSQVTKPERFSTSADVQLLPHAVLGDGQPATLHACLDPELSSTLKPLPAEQLLPAQRPGAQVLAKLPISTVALNSIAGLESLDWLILDHLSDASTILEHGHQALKDSLLIQVRTAFQPTHERQPTLAELQHWMARQGFRFYRFNDMAYESHLPARNDLVNPQSTELVSADVLFLPNHTRMAALSDARRLKLAFLLHTVFNVRDLSYALLAEVDEDKAEDYLLAQGMLRTPEEELRNANAAGQLRSPDEHAETPKAQAASAGGRNNASATGASAQLPSQVATLMPPTALPPNEPVDDEVIFVVGCGHTGTTLMACMLGAHPEVYTIQRETHWFLDKPFLDTEYPIERHQCLLEGKSRVCEKTPRHVNKIAEMKQRFPNAKFVAMTRDSKDVIASLKKRNPAEFEGMVKRYISSNQALLDHLPSKYIALIRYEDLVSAPEATMRKLMRFLGLEYTSEVLEFYKKDYHWGGVVEAKETDGRHGESHEQLRAWQMHQPIQDNRGIWKELLTKGQVKLVNQQCLPIERRLNAIAAKALPSSLGAKFNQTEVIDDASFSQKILPRSASKIFCIGFQKTGTKSLRDALLILGYSVTGPNWVNDPNIALNVYERAFETAKQYDAFQDNPWSVIYKALDIEFPNSKFVLTIRDTQSWIKSLVGFFDERSTPMREWIYGIGSPQGSEQIYIERYERHNAEVLQYFRDRPDDLLVMNLAEGDGWEKLCPFLGREAPDQPFPHVNRAEDRQAGRPVPERQGDEQPAGQTETKQDDESEFVFD